MILFPRARRRRPGLYWYRTRRHLRRGTEWGYAGMSTNLAYRADCHEGRCTRHEGCKGGKPWSDLIVRKRALRLPWWLGWKWFLLSIETVLIAILRPRYNTQKNPRSSKVPPRIQVMQRAARDQARLAGVDPYAARFQLHPVHILSFALIVTGLTGWWLTR